MKNDDASDSDLRKTFQNLREQEAKLAPDFHESVSGTRPIKHTSGSKIWIPAAAAIIIGLFPIARFWNSEKNRQSITLNLPELTIGTSDTEPLITEIPISFSGHVPTDSLIPLYLQIKL